MVRNSRRRQKIAPKVKKDVLDMLIDGNYSMSEISKAFEISLPTIKRWKATLKKDALKGEEFVEVKVIDKKKVIKKASMLFEKLVVCFDGEIDGKDLIAVIKILEGSQ